MEEVTTRNGRSERSILQRTTSLQVTLPITFGGAIEPTSPCLTRRHISSSLSAITEPDWVARVPDSVNAHRVRE